MHVNDVLTESELALFSAYHEVEPCWGSVHIVLDDGNIEDDHVQFCMNFARTEDDWDGFKIAEVLSRKTIEERQTLYEYKWR